MSQQAQVTSLDAMAAFRAHLIVILSKARPCLEDIGDTIRRTREWLQNDRQSHWLKEARRRGRELEQARQELFSAKMGNLRGPETDKQWAVSKAQRAANEAEEKLRLIRKWNREFAHLTDPLTRQIDQIHSFHQQEMARAIASLAQILSTLESYVQMAPHSAAGLASSPHATSNDAMAPSEIVPNEAMEGHSSGLTPPTNETQSSLREIEDSGAAPDHSPPLMKRSLETSSPDLPKGESA